MRVAVLANSITIGSFVKYLQSALEDAKVVVPLLEPKMAADFDLIVVEDVSEGLKTQSLNVERIQAVRKAAPEVIIIVLGAYHDLKEALLEAGADEFVKIGEHPGELIDTIRRHFPFD